MKIDLVRIRNILGITKLEFKPGKFTEISGANGTNKTSILDAIKSVMTASTHDATLLHKGAKEGEIVLVLDDGTQLTKTVDESGSKFKMKDAKSAPIPRPAETIRGLTDMISINPIDFLLAPKAERVKTLLQAMPITADVERLKKISGMGPAPFPAGTHGLKIVDDFRDRVFVERTGVNTVHREKLSTVNQLTEAMPELPKQQVEGSEEELMTQLEGIESVADAAVAAVDTKLNSWLDKQREAGEALKLEAGNQVEELRKKAAEIQAALAGNLNRLAEQTVSVKQKANDKKNEIGTNLATQSRPIESTLDLLRQNRANTAKRQQAQQTIAAMTADVEVLQSRSEWLTAALGHIDQYKLELLAALPIPGLEVRGDAEIFRDGIPLDRLNTAQQTQIAIEIAKLRAGKLGFVCVDRLEHLDTEAYNHFQEQAIASGLQFFVTRVNDSGLEITPSN